MQPPLSLVEAPSNLGLRPPSPDREPGVQRLPQALLDAGLLQSLRVKNRVRVPAPPYSGERDPEIGVLNAEAVATYARHLAEAVGDALYAGHAPLVLGGDCSILLGSMLGLRRRGRYGLVFLDGHQDLLTADTSESGGAAGMDLALVTGHGPEVLTRLDGIDALVRAEDVVLMGYRDGDEGYPPEYLDAVRGPMYNSPLEQLRSEGMSEAARFALDQLALAPLDGIWVHLDVDVLDSAIMPAVDSPQPDGLSYEELGELLVALLAAPEVHGLQVTIFDPDLDPTGRHARELVELLQGVIPQ